MKKRDLLLAGLFLCSVSSYAQEPVRYQDDAKVIFFQDFEGNDEWQQIELNPDPNRPTTLYTWEDEPIDQIEEVAYFKKQDSKDKDTLANEGSTINGINILDGSRDWEIAGYRDTVIDIWNGVVRTDAKMPDDSVLAYDSHKIVKHNAETLNGTGIGGKDYGLSRYGEQDKAGKTYFSYTSASGNGVSNWDSNNKAVPEYRRNLFIRLNPGDIEPNSSYRVTVFVKATTQTTATEITPRLGLQLMHGFFHAEKDFLVDTKNNNEFSTTTDYTDFEQGKWQKITLMSYYLTDSIAHYSAYNKGYWWPDDWVWVTEAKKDTTVADEGEGDTTMVFRYIQTPDKFFVRMSFRSDSTRFDVDNLSLTKSWIGGVEHYGDMIRVDFGYKTNLGQLAEQAKKINKIATVEVPGKYFEVWANFGGEWEEVPILSAEYQGDGYMYMWTEPLEDGSANELDEADEVLVTFRNPRDREDLFLAYTGNQYPNGLDSAWVAEGKKVFDFHNEISSLNPTITVSPVTGNKVMSLKNLPPVMQYEPYEEGTFALPTDLRSMNFKFSRTLAYDKTMSASTDKTLVSVKKGGSVEYWDITESDKSGLTTITRPAKYTDALAGDYVFSFKQVTHMDKPDPNNPDHFGADVTFNYHFGDFKTDPKNEEVTHSDWRNEDYTEDLASGQRYYPLSIYVHSGQDPFTKGTGGKSAGKCGIYTVGDEDCQIYFSNRGRGNSGNVYTIENLDKGNYSISFRAITWGSENDDKGRQCKLYVYAKPEGELENGNDKGFAVLEAATKTLIGTFAPSKYATSAGWPDGTETFEFPFNCSAKGDYVFEWVDAKDNANSAGSYHGFAIGNYSIKTAGDLSFIPVKKLNDQIAVSEAKLAEVSDAKYKGAAYNDLSQKITDAKAYNGKVKAAKLGVPSLYDSVVATLDAAIKVMDARVAIVDKLEAAKTAATTALSDETYKSSAAYADLSELIKEVGKIVISSKSDDEVAEITSDILLKSANLDAIPVITKRILALKALSVELGSTVSEEAGIKEQLAIIDKDDDNLANVLKEAIKLALYEKAAANVADETIDSIDVTPFIKNYYMYTTARLGNTNSKESVDKTKEVNIYSVQTAWWPNPGYTDYAIATRGEEYSTTFPGWTFKSDGGQNYIGLEKTDWTADDHKPIFDAWLASDWSSSVYMKQTLEDLPVGQYTIGVGMNFNESAGQDSKLIVTVGSKVKEVNPNSKVDNAPAVANVFVDSVKVSDGDKMEIKVDIPSHNSWVRVDNYVLAFRPLKDFDYAGAVAAQKTKVDELITVVNAAELKVANVELFSLGGMKIDAPKAGQVVIRKTTQSNGKIVVDKVLVK